MIGVVVAAHGRLAEELLRTAESVVGPIEQARAVAVAGGQADAQDRVREAIEGVDTGEGVLLLTDLLGGSPTNLCLSCMRGHGAEVITGVNLPMVLKAASLRKGERGLLEIARELAQAAQKSIGLVSDALAKRSAG